MSATETGRVIPLDTSRGSRRKHWRIALDRGCVCIPRFLVIVVVSWLFYRYLAPASWKEWSRAGVLQAFIIAFYAEMYGFPLTIYLLTRVFGLDVAWSEDGNLWAQLFGTEAAHLVAMVLGYAIVFSGATLVAEGWRTIHHARREGTLATEGVYAKFATRSTPGSL